MCHLVCAESDAHTVLPVDPGDLGKTVRRSEISMQAAAYPGKLLRQRIPHRKSALVSRLGPHSHSRGSKPRFQDRGISGRKPRHDFLPRIHGEVADQGGLSEPTWKRVQEIAQALATAE